MTKKVHSLFMPDFNGFFTILAQSAPFFSCQTVILSTFPEILQILLKKIMFTFSFTRTLNLHLSAPQCFCLLTSEVPFSRFSLKHICKSV